MPLPFLAEVVFNGMPFGWNGYTVLKVIGLVFLIALVKWYSLGAVNTAERQMHSKVIMITVRHPLLHPVPSTKRILTASRGEQQV